MKFWKILKILDNLATPERVLILAMKRNRAGPKCPFNDLNVPLLKYNLKSLKFLENFENL